MKAGKPYGRFIRKCEVYCDNIQDYLQTVQWFRAKLNEPHLDPEFKKQFVHWFSGSPILYFYLNKLSIESIQFSECNRRALTTEDDGTGLYCINRETTVQVSRVDYIVKDSTGKLAVYTTADKQSDWADIAHSQIGDLVDIVVYVHTDRRAEIARIKNQSLTERLA